MICTAHSKLSFDGQPLGDGKQFLAVIAKDGKLKGFFIRLVDKEVRLVLQIKYLTDFVDIMPIWYITLAVSL